MISHNHIPKIARMLVPYRRERFANWYMEHWDSGESNAVIGQKVLGAFDDRRGWSADEVVGVVEALYASGEGGMAFRAWWPLIRDGRGKDGQDMTNESAIAKKERALGRAKDGVDQLAAQARKLEEQLQQQQARHEKEMFAAVETAKLDGSRKYIQERNDANNKRAAAESALQSAIARAEKAEADVKVFQRRPAADAIVLEDAQQTLTSLRGQLTRLQNRNAELESELADKIQSIEQMKASARVVNEDPRPARAYATTVATRPPANDVMGHLTALVDGGLMSEAEAFERLRQARSR